LHVILVDEIRGGMIFRIREVDATESNGLESILLKQIAWEVTVAAYEKGGRV